MEPISDSLDELPAEWMDGHDEVLENNLEVVRERNEQVGDGLKVGKVVCFEVYDGVAWYEVVYVGDRVSRVRYVPELCPNDYKSNAVDGDGNVITDVLEDVVD